MLMKQKQRKAIKDVVEEKGRCFLCELSVFVGDP